MSEPWSYCGNLAWEYVADVMSQPTRLAGDKRKKLYRAFYVSDVSILRSEGAGDV